jgi:hypothetical protein
VALDEGLDVLDEGVADGSEQGGGGEEVPAVVAEDADHTQLALELWDKDVEVHAVDAFNFQGHMVAQDISDGPQYTHGGF